MVGGLPGPGRACGARGRPGLSGSSASAIVELGTLVIGACSGAALHHGRASPPRRSASVISLDEWKDARFKMVIRAGRSGVGPSISGSPRTWVLGQYLSRREAWCSGEGRKALVSAVLRGR